MSPVNKTRIIVLAVLAVSFQDALNAQRVLLGAVNHTPVMTSSYANSITGAELFFKCENLQKNGGI